MKLDVTDLSYDGRWYDFETGEPLDGPHPERPCLKIRPFPFSRANVAYRGGDIILSGQDMCRMFKYSLEEWANFHDADGKPLALTDRVKQLVYDFNLEGVSDFVIRRNMAFGKAKAREEENL